MASPLLFGELLDRLREEGFTVGVDHHLRVGQLVRHLSLDDIDSLADLLCPLLARSASEQRRFRRIFALYTGAATNQPVAAPEGDAPAIAHPDQTVSTGDKAKGKMLLLVIAAAISLAAAIFAAFYFRPPAPVSPGIVLTPAITEPVPVETTKTETRQSKHFQNRNVPTLLGETHRAPADLPILFAIAAFLATLGADAAYAAVMLRRRRIRAGSRLPFRTALDAASIANLFRTPEFARAARLLGGRVVGERMRWDIRRSVEATARAAGMAVLVKKADVSRREHVVLIERLSPDDHLTKYFEQLTSALAASNVAVDHYFYDSDPSVCLDPHTGERLRLTDLQMRHGSATLLMMGSAEAVPDAGRWMARVAFPAAMAPSPKRSRDEDVVMAPANVDGLLRAASLVSEGGGALPGPSSTSLQTELPSNPTIRELRDTLPPAVFTWLAACALHDVLRWDVTIALGRRIIPAFDTATLLQLIRLPWFRVGRIPETRRRALVTALGEDPRLPDLHQDIAAVLAKAVAPAHSYAAALLRLDELRHRVLASRGENEALKRIVDDLRQYPSALVRRQPELESALNDRAILGAKARLPRWTWRFLFRGGQAALGLRAFVVTLLLFAVLAGITATIVFTRPEVQRIVDVNKQLTFTSIETVTVADTSPQPPAISAQPPPSAISSSTLPASVPVGSQVPLAPGSVEAVKTQPESSTQNGPVDSVSQTTTAQSAASSTGPATVPQLAVVPFPRPRSTGATKYDPKLLLYMTPQSGFSSDQTKQLFDAVLSRDQPVVLYVHGRGNEPAKSLIGGGIVVEGKAAKKLESDYGVKVVMFSWASKASNLDDRLGPLTKATDGGNRLSDVLRALDASRSARGANSPPMTLLVHSMGTIVLQRFVEANGWPFRSRLFNSIVLTSSDSDNVGHTAWIDRIAATERVYITVNPKDPTLLKSNSGRAPGAVALGLRPGPELSENAVYVDVSSSRHELFTKNEKDPELSQFFADVFSGREKWRAGRFAIN